MAIDRGTFENLIPSHFISFTFPNPHSTKPTLNYYGDLLRIAVLDSPVQTSDPPQIAAMLVPKDREDDWIFSTKAGHVQLLFSSPGISRLILVGNLPRGADYFPVSYSRPILDYTKYRTALEESLTPLLLALSPKTYFINGRVTEIPFVTYEDNVICSVSVVKCAGSCVGEMLVEDVEKEYVDESEKFHTREFRRRLRFKRMPNLVQTEIRIVPVQTPNSVVRIGETIFQPATGCLVHPYLPPMVASLSLIASYLEKCVYSGSRPRVLCVGIGGGALLTFLQIHFGFEVFGVESDEMVVKVAKRYFGLVESELLRIFVGDGIDVIKKFARRGINSDMGSTGNGDLETDQNVNVYDEVDSKFDIIMVDLDCSDAMSGPGAPPLDFVQNSILLAAKTALNMLGIIVINVIPLSKSFYESLICELRKVFLELYEINVGNGENYVLIATVSPIIFVSDDLENSILKKLKLARLGQYMECIRRI
ncbi:hypothetical protein BVC80_1835g256 [Macleaya cordata]|uniref:Methyltransferase-like protein 13 n=1 Tax=Macleaya cordata TaxID=56857 RepID=A0A200R571_MACCD|nr:hypothetical protein BVC80_1835g256 [Macleaya cordata]